MPDVGSRSAVCGVGDSDVAELQSAVGGDACVAEVAFRVSGQGQAVFG